MKKLFVLLFPSFIFCEAGNSQILKKLGDKVKNKTEQRADQKVDNAIDTGLDKTEDAAKGETETKEKTKIKTTKDDNSSANSSISESTPQSLQAYQNYDFIAGDIIVFADDFTTDQLGEFPPHWALIKGQGTVNKSGDKTVFNILNGNYAVVKPLEKTKEYLEDAFTVEFDYFINSGDDCGYGIFVWMVDPAGSDNKGVTVGRYKTASTASLNSIEGMNDLDGTAIKQSDEDFFNHWHHIAIAYKKPQMKVYIDQNRVLVVPNMGYKPKSLEFGGVAGDENCPISIANVRVANGGSQNMLSSIFTNGNVFSTHGITFDIDKATIKPESMGVLNQVAGYLKQNASIKMEIDGHTDNSGNAAHNMTLSQQRSEAVKVQLVNMGIEASSLTTRGFGDAKPISDNITPEGKANNRRVEFIKK